MPLGATRAISMVAAESAGKRLAPRRTDHVNGKFFPADGRRT
jgi:hypothetical protein